jgi:hypothetical protein
VVLELVSAVLVGSLSFQQVLVYLVWVRVWVQVASLQLALVEVFVAEVQV